jgi:hypothetical protein
LFASDAEDVVEDRSPLQNKEARFRAQLMRLLEPRGIRRVPRAAFFFSVPLSLRKGA